MLTGTLPTLDRNQEKVLIEQNDGKVSGSISEKTDYLLAGSDPGSKHDKAMALGVTILDKNQFLKMIEKENPIDAVDPGEK